MVQLSNISVNTDAIELAFYMVSIVRSVPGSCWREPDASRGARPDLTGGILPQGEPHPLNNKRYYIDHEQRTYLCDTTLAYYLEKAPSRPPKKKKQE